MIEKAMLVLAVIAGVVTLPLAVWVAVAPYGSLLAGFLLLVIGGLLAFGAIRTLLELDGYRLQTQVQVVPEPVVIHGGTRRRPVVSRASGSQAAAA